MQNTQRQESLTLQLQPQPTLTAKWPTLLLPTDNFRGSSDFDALPAPADVQPKAPEVSLIGASDWHSSSINCMWRIRHCTVGRKSRDSLAAFQGTLSLTPKE